MRIGRAEKAGLATGQVFDLAGLVDWADGAIVSRTLAQDTGGSVTLFAFDRGQALSEHTTPYDALVQVLAGEGSFTIAGAAHSVAAGQVLLMPANVPHAVDATARFKMLLTMIRKPPAPGAAG